MSNEILLCLFELQVYEFSQEFIYSLKKFEFKKMLDICFAFHNISPLDVIYVANSHKTGLLLLNFITGHMPKTL